MALLNGSDIILYEDPESMIFMMEANDQNFSEGTKKVYLHYIVIYLGLISVHGRSVGCYYYLKGLK